jgi:predicted PhzF superfamily epimerase YddE/YHI9
MSRVRETLTKKELASCFNSDVATDDSMPIQIVSTGLRDIILPIKNLEGLYALQLDEARTTALCERYDAVGIHAFCKESAGKGSALRHGILRRAWEFGKNQQPDVQRCACELSLSI